LNRIDECSSLTDLLRVYGTLCWNLSQITGRKDIPMIHLTYSPNASPGIVNGDNCETGFLHSLQNQREEIRKAIQQTPQRHLDHLATFVETHSERLAHLLEALISYRKKLRVFKLKFGAAGVLISLLVGAASGLGLAMVPFFAGQGPLVLLGIGGFIGAGAHCGLVYFYPTIFQDCFSPKTTQSDR
jgi:EH domain-containing protein 1